MKTKKLMAFLLALLIVLPIIPAGMLKADAATVNSSEAKSKIDTLMKTYPAGSRWTDSFDGGVQCYGFAKLVIYNVFGSYNSTRYRSWTYAGVSTSGMNVLGSITSYSADNVKALLSKASCGDVLQFDSTKQHSMIVYQVDSDGVWIYDCNWDGNCGIRLTKCSFGTWSGRNSNKLTLLCSDNHIHETFPNPEVDSRYPTPFNAYTKNGLTYEVYQSINGPKVVSGFIAADDLCTVNAVYTNGWLNVTYPLDNGGTKTCYAPSSEFFDVNYTPLTKTAIVKTAAYRRSDLANTIGNVYVDDVCTIVGESGDYYQFITNWATNIMPSGKACGWVNKSAFQEVHIHTYVEEYEAVHPHRVYMRCTGCGDTYYTGATTTMPGCYDCIPSRDNRIDVWAWGFEHQEGDNGDVKTARLLGSTVFSKKVGEQYYINSSYNTIAIPNGYTTDGSGFGTSSFAGFWEDYPDGSLLTQPDYTCTFEFDCRPISYNIYYVLNGGTNSSSNPSTYNVLYGVTFSAPTRDGYTFIGWTDANGNPITGINPGANANHSSAEELYSILANRTTGDKTVYANWAINTHTDVITLWAVGFQHEEGENNGKYARCLGSTYFNKAVGEKFSLYANNNTFAIPNGYTLENYFGTGGLSNEWQSFKFGDIVTQPDHDLGFEFVCGPDWYSITYELNGGTNSSNNPSSYNVLYGVTFEAPTREGYIFTGWTDANGNPITGINPGANADHSSAEELYSILANRTTGDVTVYANWAPITYSVKFDANGGTNAPAKQTKMHGEELTLRSGVPTRDGYTFKGWATDRNATIAEYMPGGSFDIDANTTLYAVWSDNSTAIIKGDVNGDGEVDSLDAVSALKYDAGMIDLDDAQLAAADVNGDSEVNSLDGALIFKYDAGLIDEF